MFWSQGIEIEEGQAAHGRVRLFESLGKALALRPTFLGVSPP